MTDRWLLIDDIRDLGCDVTARTAAEGLAALRSGPWACAVFDNDLGEGTEGWQVMQTAIRENILPKRVQLVTSNSAAKMRMEAMLLDAGYKEHGRYNFIKEQTK